MTENTPISSRYPGIRAFERTESNLFFGRSHEVAELLSMVKVKPLTVLFAKSGIGKSSLMNAGLIPLLDKNGFFAIKIRLQDTDSTPVETVKSSLTQWLDQDKYNRFADASTATLWDYIRSCTFPTDEEGREQIPVLIFDQFEELFNHPVAQQEALTLGLADLINERLPYAVQQRMREYPRRDRSEALLDWFSPLKIRIVFAIRTDRLGELDRLKYHIPTVLHDRFYLPPLSQETAREAITVPAAIEAKNLSSAAFGYSEAALTTMLEALRNEKGEVESFQLQLLCQYIENEVIKRKITQVEPSVFGKKEGVSTILNDYYEREISQLLPEEQPVARRFFEEGLIDNGRRVGIPEGAEQSRFGVGAGLLYKLLESRLLRAEVIHLGKIYELSHDTLVAPVSRSYEQRRLEEERQAAERALDLQRARTAEAEAKRRRARMIAIAGLTLAGLALIGGIFSWRNAQRAKIAQRSAEVSALAAKAWEVDRDDHTLALRLAEAALRLDSTNEDARQTLKSMVNIPTSAYYGQVYTGHRFEVNAIDFSPDSKLVATGGSFDYSLQIWDRASGERIAQLEEDTEHAHTSHIRAVEFSPDGQFVYSAAENGLVKVINLKGEWIREFKTHKKTVNDMCLSANGQLLATVSADTTGVVWTVDGKKLQVLRGHTGRMRSVDIAPDNKLVATSSEDGTARIWNMANGVCVKIINVGGPKVNDIIFSPNGKQVLLACSDNTARLYTVDGQLITPFPGHTAEVIKVAFAPDGQSLFTASKDHTARMWTLAGEERLLFAGHTERLSGLAISPDMQWLATGSYDLTVKLWNLPFNLKNRYDRSTSQINKVAISPDGQKILSASDDTHVKMWHRDGRLLFDLPAHRYNVTNVAFTTDGTRFLSSSADGTVQVRRTDNAQLLFSILADKKGVLVQDAKFSPDNASIAVVCGREISLWSSTDGHFIRSWDEGSALQRSVEFDASGTRLITAGYNSGQAKIWNLQGELLDSTIGNEEARMQYAVFVPGTQNILTVAKELPVKLWDSKGVLLHTYYGHLNESYHIAFAPDKQRFATSSWDKTVRIWTISGNCELVLKHPDGVYGSVFTPDNQYLITACRDKIVRIWDLRTGQLVQVFGGQLNADEYLRSTYIAPLSTIPFSLERYAISSYTARQIFGSNSATMLALANRYIASGTENNYDYALASRDFDYAEAFVQQARALPDVRQADCDSVLAEIYSNRAYLYLNQHRYQELLSTADKGLNYRTLPMLKVYQTFGYLLNNEYDRAEKQAVQLSMDTTTVLPFYNNYKEAFLGETDYYQKQLGIQELGLERLTKRLTDKE